MLFSRISHWARRSSKMKNLKLLSHQHVSNIEAESFCLYGEENVYFVSKGKIYCLSNGFSTLTFCSDLPSEIPEEQSVAGMEYLIEPDKIFIASSSGEIFTYDIYSNAVSSVGVVESGIEGFAWSPDQECVVVLTGNNTFILMTQYYEPIIEKSLCPDDFGESKPITVGWGSKETQFHGSEGKEAAKVKKIEPKPALPYDDQCPQVSWRGDGEYFVTSSIHSSKGYRQLRIWDRHSKLMFTSEIKEGLEEPICWKPSGSVIACSQQDANKHKIIFFEKNGLQHGEFALPFKPDSHRVTHLSWNSESTVLLIVAQLLENPSSFKVMLWTCSNYHWYLKQSFALEKVDSEKNLIAIWSQNNPFELSCLNQSTNKFHQFNWAWTVSFSHGVSEIDDALVASIDNDSILITPFATMVVPPPMCAYSFTLPSAVQSVCFSPNSARFCCYLGNFNLAFFQKGVCLEIKNSEESKLKLIAAGGKGFNSKVQPYGFEGIMKFTVSSIETSEFGLCHWTWVDAGSLLFICTVKQGEANQFALMSLTVPSMQQCEAKLVCRFDHSIVGMCSNVHGNVVAVQLNNRNILKMTIEKSTDISKSTIVPWVCDDGTHLVVSQPCLTMSIIQINGKDYFLGLTERFHLFCNKTLVLKNCTSYYIHDEYLLATTTDHTLKFFLINHDLADLETLEESTSVIQSQKIEKGARIIIAPSKTTKVILQMPRGNLETLHPRPLVLSCVCKYLDELQFAPAFTLAKIHRIDFNILYDHNPEGFLNNVNHFLDQLNSESNINLFLASLKEEDVCETLYSLAYKGRNRPPKLESQNTKINSICNAIREVLMKKNDNRFFLSLIATYAKKSEPELEEALILLKNMKDTDPAKNKGLVDSALNFLLYLVDVNDLIDVALGTYDLEITIMVSQKSQKDPKEFLPFYNDLQEMEENYRKYKIDMHLQRYKSALQHISKCEDNFEECLALIKSQRLFTDSLNLFPRLSDKYKVVWKEYGCYLMDKRYFDEAGLAFVRCEEYERALLAYKESLNWQCMLCAAMHISCSDDQIISLCVEMAEKLKSNQKYLDASYLLEQYTKDIEESIVILIEGSEWSSALHLMSKYRRPDICDTHLVPALKDHSAYLRSQLEELSADFQKHVERLKVIRLEKQQSADLPDVVKHHDEELFSETGSVTDVASSVTESKQLSGSIMTRKSSKSRRKQKLKKYRLKEGSPDEDLAHISALAEIVVKIDSLKDNFLNTLKILVQFGFDVEAKSLQCHMCDLIALVESQMTEIWRPLEENSFKSEMKFGPDSTSNSITAHMLAEKQNQNVVKTDPELTQPTWRKIDCGLQMFR